MNSQLDRSLGKAAIGASLLQWALIPLEGREWKD